MTLNEYVTLLKPLATPIDFEDLIARGILKKAARGKRSYLLLSKLSELPEHAGLQVAAITPTKRGLQLTFMDTARVEKLLDEGRRPLRMAVAPLKPDR